MRTKKVLLILILLVVLGVLAGLPLIYQYVISPDIENHILLSKQKEAMRLAEHLASMYGDRGKNEFGFHPGDMFLDYIRSFSIIKVKAYNSEGVVIYSTEPGDLGGINDEPYFRNRVMRGEPYSEIKREGESTLEGEDMGSGLVETYVPVMYEGNFIGAFEIYYDISGEISFLNTLFHKSRVLPWGVSFISAVFIIIAFLKIWKDMESLDRAGRSLSERNALLERRKRFLEDVIESIPHPFAVIDAKDYRIIHANSSYMKGGGDFCYEVAHGKSAPCDVSGEVCTLKEIINRKSPVIVEHRHLINNEERICEVHGYPLANERGEIVRIIEYSMDVTERVKTEEQIKSTNQMLRDVLESAPTGILIVNEAGEVEYVNKTMLMMSGLDMGDFLSLNLFEHEQYRRLGLDELLKRVFQGEAFETGPVRYESLGGLETYRVFRGIPVSIDQKKKCFIFVEDLTERISYENALKESRERFRAVSENARDGIVTFDERGIITYWNRAAADMFGYGSEEAVGRRIGEILTGREVTDWQGIGEFLSKQGSLSIGSTFEVVAFAKTGEEIPVEMSIARWNTEGDVNYTAIIRDITDRKALEDALLHEKEKIQGLYLELLKKNEIIEENKRRLEDAIEKIAELIHDVVIEKSFGVRFKNPALKKCYELKGCRYEDCPCYGKEAMRCWAVAGTFCGGEVKGGFAKKLSSCEECEVFRNSVSDPLFRIGELFNTMMEILEAKNRELEEAYNELKMTQSQILQQEKMASIG
ncbi:MAG: PAS domain S-box protein, partial [Nitrospirae bacterium]